MLLGGCVVVGAVTFATYRLLTKRQILLRDCEDVKIDSGFIMHRITYTQNNKNTWKKNWSIIAKNTKNKSDTKHLITIGQPNQTFHTKRVWSFRKPEVLEVFVLDNISDDNNSITQIKT